MTSALPWEGASVRDHSRSAPHERPTTRSLRSLRLGAPHRSVGGGAAGEYGVGLCLQCDVLALHVRDGAGALKLALQDALEQQTFNAPGVEPQARLASGGCGFGLLAPGCAHLVEQLARGFLPVLFADDRPLLVDGPGLHLGGSHLVDGTSADWRPPSRPPASACGEVSPSGIMIGWRGEAVDLGHLRHSIPPPRSVTRSAAGRSFFVSFPRLRNCSRTPRLPELAS